jgi:hypothetical protein
MVWTRRGGGGPGANRWMCAGGVRRNEERTMLVLNDPNMDTILNMG